MNLKVYIPCFLASLTCAFQCNYNNTVVISKRLQLTKCEQVNVTEYQCSSLYQGIQLLSTCCNSTNNNSVDINIVESGSYALNVSFTFSNFTKIRLSSNGTAEIKCPPNVNGSYNFDTGLAFIGARKLTIQHLNITGCGMKHMSSVFFGKHIVLRSALFILNSTNLLISNINVFDNNGAGLLIYDTNGMVNITDSLFTGNKLKEVENTKYLAGGGGIYIEYTNCTPGVVACDPEHNMYHRDSIYIIDNCMFKNNIALYNFSHDEPDRLADNVHVYYGVGGGLSVQLHGLAYNNSFLISNNVFDSNEANSGGGLTVDVKQSASSNTVIISNSSFYNNSASMYQGGGGAYIGIALYQKKDKSFYNSFVLINCTFIRNHALKGVGGGIMGYASHEPDIAQASNEFKIHNSHFYNNEALYGSAIQINKEYHASLVEGNMLTFIMDNCSFVENNLQSMLNSKFDSVGAVSSSGVNVQFQNHTRFYRNNSTALVVDGAYAGFFNDSFTEFTENKGLHGGAILLIGESWIQVHPNSTLLFLNNTAVACGGAIYVELSTPYEFILSHSCFVRYSSESSFPNKWNTNFTFINNTAGQVNNTIFANTLQPCLKFYVEHTCTKTFLYQKPFYYHPNTTSHLIMTSPLSFNFSSDNKDFSLDVIPGEVYDLQVSLVDELCQNVTETTFIANCMEAVSPYVSPLYRFTNGSIQIAGKPKDTCHLQLKTDTDYQVTKMVNITLLNCPPGFVFVNSTAQCECVVNETHSNYAIKGCELNRYQANYNPLYWIGYESENGQNLLFGSCPYRYCYTDHVSQNELLPRNASKVDLDRYVCGRRNRTGLLCGECVDGYSVLISSPTFACYKCKGHHLGVLYLLLDYIIPVSILFVFIMTFNVRMTYGPFSAFLFYSQIISSQYHRNMDYILNVNSPTTLSVSSILLTIYSISNLDFFQHEEFAYCLFSNAGTVDVMGFNALLSLYPLLLITVYFMLRRLQYRGMLCKRQSVCFNKLRLSNNSVTHGISAFLVLSFAKINVTVFTILKSADISRVDEATSHYRTVVLMQGNTEYFDNLLYNIYAIGSLFLIFTVIVIPTVILTVFPIVVNIGIVFGWTENPCIQVIYKCLLIHRLKPILDSFQGDYKSHLHFFAGVYFFLYRSLFFCMVVGGSTTEINALFIFIIVFFFLITTVHVLTMPFKRYIDNATYTSIYMLMLALWTMEYFLLPLNGKLSYTVALLWFRIILSSLPLCIFVLYCILKLLNKVWSFRRAKSIRYEPLLAFPDRLINDDNDDDDDDDDDENVDDDDDDKDQ